MNRVKESPGEFLAGIVILLAALALISRWPMFFGLLTFAVFVFGLIAVAVLDFQSNRIPRRTVSSNDFPVSDSNEKPVNDSNDFPVRNSNENLVENPDTGTLHYTDGTTIWKEIR